MIDINGKIYIIYNTINNKAYVGQTIRDVKVRFKQHLRLDKSSCNQLIYKAIVKYGKENFKYEILKENINNYTDLNYFEEYYVKEKNTLSPNGYNLCPGGQKYRRRPIFEELEENKIIDMYINKKSTRQIALEMGTTHGTILRVLRRNNIETRPKNYNLPDRSSKIKKEELNNLYQQNLSTVQIANILNVDQTTIRRAKRDLI